MFGFCMPKCQTYHKIDKSLSALVDLYLRTKHKSVFQMNFMSYKEINIILLQTSVIPLISHLYCRYHRTELNNALSFHPLLHYSTELSWQLNISNLD